MSRTTRQKATHYNEYWGRRSWAGGGKHAAIHGPLTKRVTHRKERREGKLMCALGSLLLLLSLSGCAQPVTASDDIEARGIAAATAALGDDKPQESAAPLVEQPAEITEPYIDPEPVKYMPPEDPPEPTIAVRFFTSASCAPCVIAEREIERFNAPPFSSAGWKVGDWEPGVKRNIHIVRWEKHRDQFDLYSVQSTPAYVMTVDGRVVGYRSGRQTAEQIEGWIRTRLQLAQEQIAPEVATQRPFAEPWRNSLPRQVRNLVHTDCETGALELPTTQLNLKAQSVEFLDSRQSRLNRWFSVYLPPGSVKHSGNSVEFSNPPELRFHITEGGKGVRLDSLKSIEFVDGGANFHLAIGTIHFRVK